MGVTALNTAAHGAVQFQGGHGSSSTQKLSPEFIYQTARCVIKNVSILLACSVTSF